MPISAITVSESEQITDTSQGLDVCANYWQRRWDCELLAPGAVGHPKELLASGAVGLDGVFGHLTISVAEWNSS